MKRLSLKWRAAIGVTGMTIIIVVMISFFQMMQMRRDFVDVLAEQQFALATRAANDLDSKFLTYSELLSLSAGRFPINLLGSPSRVREYYQARPALLAAFDAVIVVGLDGQVIADYPEVPGRTKVNISDRPSFQKVLKTGKLVISEPLAGRAGGGPIVQIGTPIFDGKGALAAVLLGVLRLNKGNFLADIASAKVGKTGFFVIFTNDEKPVFVVHPLQEMILKPRGKGTAAGDRAISGIEGTFEDVSPRGQRALFAVKKLRVVNWILSVVVPMEEVLAPAEKAIRDLWIACAIACAVLIPLVWAGTWLLLSPLTRLRDEVIRQSAGTQAFVPITASAAGEVEEVAQAFNDSMRRRFDAEQRIKEAAARLQTITNNVPVMIAYIDSALVVRFMNRPFEHYYGIPEGGFTPKPLAQLVAPENMPLIEARCQQALAGTTVTFQVERTIDGEVVTLESTYVPDLAADGGVPGFHVLVNNITTFKKTKDQLGAMNASLEQRIRERTQALEKSNAELETFAYTVAHHFRSPLRVMAGFGAMLAQECGPQLTGQCGDYLQRIQASSTKLAGLIDDLLRMAQLSRQPLERTEVALSEIAAEAVSHAGIAGADFSMAQAEIAPGLQIFGDRDLIRVLLDELFSNACKFAHPQRPCRIRFGVDNRDGEAVYFVEDNGIGIDMKHADRIFAPFERLAPANDFDGTGIGLAIAKRIVEAHDGEIWVEASRVCGAKVMFTLPG